MAVLSPERVAARKLRNLLHSLLLIGAMVALLCAVGFFVAGVEGLIFFGAFWLGTLLLAPRLSPAILLRFYRARPLSPSEAPVLFETLAELAHRAGLPCLPRLYYVPTRLANAFSMGTCDDAVIGITDGLLRTLNLRELTGVLAHEISHIANNDVRVMALADLISRATHLFSLMGQFFLILNLPLLLLHQGGIPWGAVLLLIFAPTVSALLQLALSRTREFDADLDAVRITGDPEGLSSALRKLDIAQQSFFRRILLPGLGEPEPSLLRTHPPTEERIRRLMELKERLPVWEGALAIEEPLWIDEILPPTELGPPSWRLTGLWH